MMEEKPQRDEEVGRRDPLPSKKLAQLALATGLLVGLALLVLLVWYGLLWYFSPQTDLSIRQRQALVQGLASVAQAAAVGLTGAAGLIGLGFTWRNLRHTRESTQRTLELTEQGQITERFTRAIDQLGATDDKGEKKLEIRLGGIYALERIASDSPERDYSRDYGTVMEVLTAYVRENASWPSRLSQGLSETVSASSESGKQPAPPNPCRPAADIQAILDVLGRRAQDIRLRFEMLGTHTLEDKIVSAHLGRAEARLHLDLHGTNLRGANLREAYLRGAYLQGANLERADLQGADLQRANLERAILKAADLKQADLKQADLKEAILEQAELERADLQGANLERAILEAARLRKAALQRANLRGANLYGTNLQEAFLQETILEGAYLKNAYLQKAGHGRADLQGAELKEAILEGAEVTDEQLDDTLSLKGATMPDGQILKGDNNPDGPTFKEWLKSKGRRVDRKNRSPS